MERKVQAGSGGRFYVLEGHKVVAGPYERVLAERLTASWNRRQVPQQQVALTEEDLRYVAWIGELLMECDNNVEVAWCRLVEYSEWFDGEAEVEAAERARFVRFVPVAQAQNQAIHGSWMRRNRTLTGGVR